MNKKLLRTTAYVVLAAMLLCGLSSCTTWDNFRKAFIDKDPDPVQSIKIGVLEPLSGEFADEAADEVEGIELAFELFPQILGRPIELVYMDNKSDVDLTKEAAAALAEEDVSFVLGSYGNLLSLAAGDVFKEAEIPAIAISCTNPLITQTNSFYARVCYIDSYEAKGAAHFVFSVLNEPDAAIMYQAGNDYGKAKAEEFSEYLSKAANTEKLPPITFPAEEPDYNRIFEDMENSGAKVVYLPESAEISAQIIEEARTLGFDFTWVGTSKWDGIEEEGVYYTVDYNADSYENSLKSSLLSLYREKHGEDAVPPENTALGFDAYVIALKAIHDAKDPDDGALIAQIITQIYGLPCATGTITMDGNGDPIKPITVKQIKDSVPVTVYSVTPVK